MSNNEAQNQHENHGNELSPNLINAVSGTFTSALVDALWNEGHGTEMMKSITACLWEFHEQGKYEAIVGAVRMLYITAQTDMPEVIDAILRSDDDKLHEIYFYEFLSDFDDLCRARHTAIRRIPASCASHSDKRCDRESGWQPGLDV